MGRKSGEVADAAGQAAGAVQNVAATTEEQTAAMEEVASAAFKLKDDAAEMEALLAKFRKSAEKSV